MKNLKNLIFILFILFIELFVVKTTLADVVIDNGLNYLKSQQDSTGRITNGFSAPSQWSAIAFATGGIDISTIKNPSISLQDFLVGNVPSEPSAATDWETRILAIVATNGDPTNYGGTNYVTHLESFFNNNQIGDECSLNDDIFGLLAEIAVGASSSAQVKEDVLSFLISKQDSVDGGFGYSAPGCAWYSTSADMTGAGIQALVEAKKNGLTNPDLNTAIDRAKNYLLANQNIDGGFGYYGSSDTDSTGWVLMAFNVLDMKDSTASANTKNWLISQQSIDDGGFLAFDYGLNKSVSNSTTTAQAVIALSGKSWILKIFEPSTLTPTSTSSVMPTPTVTPTNTPTPTSTPIPTLILTSTPQSTSTPVPTFTPTPTSIPTLGSEDPTPTIISPTSGQILGIQTNETNKRIPIQTIIFFGLGILSLIIHKGIM
ncbi:MAG: prenyltransferase/squalene oxidase repeat-containing protein [Patescibacteria group bacterium]